ncbi:hypothetical protein DPMN_104388 [Dreissena polymorpha]|uniref:Uncharacterized protein n=1 Tax=Dreissena polymorpha TaxID=45954 RepID=A0A9D4K137_DREPO|nr:hypothetical protein DPMN_104388 [Dreissena polymorpha]
MNNQLLKRCKSWIVELLFFFIDEEYRVTIDAWAMDSAVKYAVDVFLVAELHPQSRSLETSYELLPRDHGGTTPCSN